MAQAKSKDFSTLETRRPASGLLVSMPAAPTSPSGFAPVAVDYFGLDEKLPLSESSSDQTIFTEAGNHDSSKQVTSVSTPWSANSERVWELPGTEGTGRPRKICHLRPKLFLGLLILLSAIIATIVGAVVGTRVHRSSQQTQSAPSPTSNQTAASVNSAMADQSHLASIAWNDTEGTTHHRLYFQDTNNSIRESAWDSKGHAWMPNPTPIVPYVKPNSPLAAAVTGPRGSTFQIDLFAVGEQNALSSWSSQDGTSWVHSVVSSHRVSSVSNLAAVWVTHEGCVACPDSLLVVYQSNNGKLQLGNATVDGKWSWSTLQSSPAIGSGLAMTLFWWPQRPAGVRLYYQTMDLHLVSLDWDSVNYDIVNATDSWVLREWVPLDTLPSRAPITSFSWGTALTRGNPKIVDILSSGLQGVRVNEWACGPYQWRSPQQPSVMAPVQNYSSIAANADARAYAKADGAVWEFGLETELSTWTKIGAVST